MSSITNSGCDIIKQKLDINNNNSKSIDTENYEIESTKKWIEINNFQRVGLQFPDELLSVSIPISLELKTRVNCQLGIMADTSYSSCCVDTVSADHFQVDAIVHYGNACLTPISQSIPVKYVFGEYRFDGNQIDQAVKSIENHFKSIENEAQCLLILSDFRYSSFCRELSEKLSSSSSSSSSVSENRLCVHRSVPNYPGENRSIDGYKSIGSRLIDASCENRSCRRSVVFIGDDIDHSVRSIFVAVRSNLSSSYIDRSRLFVLSPRRSAAISNASDEIERVLKARRHSVEVARAARRVGLLVASLSADRLVDGYERLREAMRARNKLVYPLVVGRINPNKLANFSELDCVVVLGCPMSALEFCRRSAFSEEFFRPLVTPFEMACACADPAHPLSVTDPLNDRYVTDFRDLIGDLAAIGTRGPDDRDAAESADGCEHALVQRLDSQWSVSSIDRSTRSWFGLDPKMGQTEVALVKDGRFGVAAGYRDEIDFNK